MDNDILSGLEGFDSVWQRVSGAAAAGEAGGDVKTLERFMEGEARDAQFYTQLAKRLSNPARSVVLGAAADEKRHMKKLQLEYFLLTGNSYCPAAGVKNQGGTLSALREAYVDEKEGAAAYTKAAGETALPELSALYTEQAADEARHAREMRGLISRAMA